MIPSELVKKLKDAGYPQNTDRLVSGSVYKDYDMHALRALTHRDIGYHVTYDSSIGETLEELRSKPFEEWHGKCRASVYMSEEYLSSEEGKELTFYKPNLSELVEAVGGYIVLEKHYTGWTVFWSDEQFQSPAGLEGIDTFMTKSENSKSPEEAVANLWLYLNKKS